jgi:hypothetical protein
VVVAASDPVACRRIMSGRGSREPSLGSSVRPPRPTPLGRGRLPMVAWSRPALCPGRAAPREGRCREARSRQIFG